MGPTPAVAAVRRAVRTMLSALDPAVGVLVACSGGPDSVALAAATAFECSRSGRPHGLVTVDHGLQDASAEQAGRVGALGYELGFDPVHVVAVTVGTGGGLEAAARTARYAAIDRVRGDAAVLLGHTADDQAETVLLGLGRGSGPRSVAGMRPVAGPLHRPLLGLRRSVTVDCCADLGLPVWDDPHNADPRFRRVRVRTELLPLMDDVLAGGVVDALARTATMIAQDSDALDALAEQALPGHSSGGCLLVAGLVELHAAIRSRLLRLWLIGAGVTDLAAVHLRELDRLVTDWRGQSRVELPGDFSVVRSSGRLCLQGPPAPGGGSRHDWESGVRPAPN